MTLADFPPWFLRGFAVLFGLLWGSFLNVVIYRVPRGMSVSHPPSHCPTCKKPIRPWQNLPVVAWVMMGGRSRCCREKISVRYPLVESIGGVLSLAIVELCVLPLPITTSMAQVGAIYAADFALALGLVATAFIDVEHLVVLPDRANLAGAILGIATSTLRGHAVTDGLVGAAVGIGCGAGINGIYKLVRGRSGFASGDTVLLGVLGAWFGWSGALFGLFAGSVQGAVLMLVFRVLGGRLEEPESVKEERAQILAEIEALPEEERERAMKEWREEDELADASGEGMQAALPFGPFIALAGLELLLFGGALADLFFLWTQA